MSVRSVSKYRNKQCIVDGITFSSIKESHRYQQLKLLLRAGMISDLRLQTRLPIVIGDMLICHYVADFDYLDEVEGRRVYEDVKSPATRTQVYRLKKKLVQALHGISVVEV